MVKVPKGLTLVVGLGISGRAICRHLERCQVAFMVADTRATPPGIDEFHVAHPGVKVHCGALSELDLSEVEEVVLSPGIDPMAPGLEMLTEQINPVTGEPRLVGEIALFVRAAKAPIAAITGSNAKSTVTTLLGEMAVESGIKAAVGGNLGTPALDLLADEPEAPLYILELSSFQLETTPHLGAASAAFLNLSEDHLDRHGDMQAYQATKQRIFNGAQHGVVNADDAYTWPSRPVVSQACFTLNPPEGNQWGIADQAGEPWLMQGATPWLSIAELKMPGRHNQANALASLAMGQALGFKRNAMLEVLKRFKGLAHRTEVVGEINGVTWINDSKGTNVGATLAAIEGIGGTLSGRLILLAGGVGKGADFTPLAGPLSRCARLVLVFGTDAEHLCAALKDSVDVQKMDQMHQAIQAAHAVAEPGDCVLLSPACASLDQFANYQERGDIFRGEVSRLATQASQQEAT
ncbi:UDP-N-acetylmuramoyl-L-alanine--D-glutamate ligase [Halomonas sediminis]